ncbi:MAG: hypothetical protein HUJ13_08050 [Hydrogenovibrio crunogenus]|uniref:Xaa-Pro dipeptidyl-peptidase-like domain-containing protein n=1 Tax=Hydrogenovibrio crunogenus (strain DSM 25203 / XCL-2) TaxID=317025 RepID=Q31IH5_HYDCU|nr:hypothetical protein [Hydrogenovibrio crunogenus]
MTNAFSMTPDFIAGQAGRLEIRMTRPGQNLTANLPSDSPHKWVVLSHPHPQFGGTMDNKVVTTMEKTFQSLGYGTLAYNFRGVGKSEGNYDGGEGEQQDLYDVVCWLRENVGLAELVLAGFSFGSYITLKQVDRIQPTAICTVAPPVSMYDFSGIQPIMPWYLIQGGQDEVIDAKEVLDWAMQLKKQPDIFWRGEASHFFHRQLIWLKKILITTFEK